MRHTKEIQVGDHIYTVTQYSATKGLKTLTRLIRLIGEPLGALTGVDPSQPEKAITEAIKALVMRLDEAEVESLIKSMLEGVRVDGQPLMFDIHFAGRLGHLMAVVKEIVMYQFGDFFSLLQSGQDVVGQVQAQLQS